MAQRTTFICACLIKQVLRTMPRHIVVLQPRDQGITQCASRKSIPMSSTPRTTSAGRHTIPPPPRITTADPGQIHHPQNRATPAPSHAPPRNTTHPAVPRRPTPPPQKSPPSRLWACARPCGLHLAPTAMATTGSEHTHTSRSSARASAVAGWTVHIASVESNGMGVGVDK